MHIDIEFHIVIAFGLQPCEFIGVKTSGNSKNLQRSSSLVPALVNKFCEWIYILFIKEYLKIVLLCISI